MTASAEDLRRIRHRRSAAGMVMREAKPVQRTPEPKGWEPPWVLRSRMAMAAALASRMRGGSSVPYSRPRMIYVVRRSRTRLALNSVFGRVPGGTTSIFGRTSQRETISVSTSSFNI